MNKAVIGILGAIAVCVSHAGAPDMEDEWTDDSPVQMTEPPVRTDEVDPNMPGAAGLLRIIACQAYSEQSNEHFALFLRDLNENEQYGFRLFNYVSCLELALLLQKE